MRIGYLCKYAPVELLQSMGAQTVRIMPEAADFSQADMLMHTNMCSFIKGVLEEFSLSEGAAAPSAFSAASENIESDTERKPFDGILLTNCCDSTRRLYDVLKRKYPEKFIYMIDVPRMTGKAAEAFYADSLKELIKAYEAYSGVSFRSEEFIRVISSLKGDEEKNDDAGRAANEEAEPKIRIGLMGARASRGVLEMIHNYNIEVLFDMTCTGVKREFQIPEALMSESAAGEGLADSAPLLEDYADQLLRQTPCMRMHDIHPRQELLEAFSDQLYGIIYHTVKFLSLIHI